MPNAENEPDDTKNEMSISSAAQARADEETSQGFEPAELGESGADASEVFIELFEDVDVSDIASDKEVLAALGVEQEPEGNEPVDEEVAPERFIVMSCVDVVMRLPDPYPIVVLEESDSFSRQLRIPVGPAEGSAIASALRSTPSPRPLTHRFFVDALEAFNLSIEVMRITEVRGRTFFAEIVISGPHATRTIECRPSDGIAAVLRASVRAPITVSEQVLRSAGVSRRAKY